MNEKIYEKIAFLSQKLVTLCKENAKKVSTAESCTGGMISAAITSVSGSSSVIEMGICSYSNRIKSEILGVSDETLADFSEYSEICALEMASGARRLSGADYAVSTTGVAGPTGDSPEHPVGEVFIAVCSEKETLVKRFLFDGNRGQVRAKACETALELIISVIEKDLQ